MTGFEQGNMPERMEQRRPKERGKPDGSPGSGTGRANPGGGLSWKQFREAIPGTMIAAGYAIPAYFAPDAGFNAGYRGPASPTR